MITGAGGVGWTGGSSLTQATYLKDARGVSGEAGLIEGVERTEGVGWIVVKEVKDAPGPREGFHSPHNLSE